MILVHLTKCFDTLTVSPANNFNRKTKYKEDDSQILINQGVNTQ